MTTYQKGICMGIGYGGSGSDSLLDLLALRRQTRMDSRTYSGRHSGGGRVNEGGGSNKSNKESGDGELHVCS